MTFVEFYKLVILLIHQQARIRVAWINPEESESGQAIGVALNDTVCLTLMEQIGNHHKWVFVHTESKKRPNGTLTPRVRKMRVDSNTA